jgi:hypothetical protein
MSRILKSALLGGLLIATTALASSPSSNPIQSFSASPGTITAGQTTTLTWVVEGAKDVTLSGVSATPASSAVVAPSHTTTYTLTARTNGDKFASKEVLRFISTCPKLNLFRLILTIQRPMAFSLQPPCRLRPGTNSPANIQ